MVLGLALSAATNSTAFCAGTELLAIITKGTSQMPPKGSKSFKGS